MKLYYSPGSCSLAPHIIMRETGTAVNLVKTDIKSKTYDGGGNFAAINPLGYVPALQLDDGSVLVENPAILLYIADKSGQGSKVMPAAGSADYYKMLSWLGFVSSEMHGPFGPLWNPAQPAEAKAIATTRLNSRFAHLDKHFASNKYLVGDQFTLPDTYAFAVLGWAPMLKMDLSAYKNVQAYVARIAARPAVQASLKAEGLA